MPVDELRPAPDASIIIPVYNRTDEVLHLLEQLRDQTSKSFEVSIADDCSDTPLSKCVFPEQYPFPVMLTRLPERSGIARARNAAIANSRGEIIVFLDSDCILQDEAWVDKHVRIHRDPWVDCLKGFEDYVVHGRVNGIHSTYAGYSDGYSNWFVSCGNAPYEATRHHLPTNNTSVSRRAFDRVGGFFGELRYMEDLDWMLRCKNKGIRLFYVPDMAVGHQDRETFDALWSHYYEMGKYSVPIRRRNHDSPYHFLFPSGRFSGWLLFLPLTTAMTLFILMRWIKVDLRVLYYLPGLWWANVAYYRGIQYFLDSE